MRTPCPTDATPAPARRMRRAQRVEAILSELSATGNVHVGELSERFGVSEATLRRDLTLLEDQDLLTRTHGGALAQNVGYSLPMRQRDLPLAESIRAIARIAARCLPAGPWTEQIAASINIGTLFIHGEGLSAAGGLTSSDETQVRTTRALIGRAQRVVVVAPGSAIGHVALTRIAGADGVHEVITDMSAPGPQLSALQEARVSVGVATPGTD